MTKRLAQVPQVKDSMAEWIFTHPWSGSCYLWIGLLRRLRRFSTDRHIYKEMLDFCHQYQVRVQSEGSAFEEAWLERLGTLGLG